MNEIWKNAIITGINTAVYVAPNTRKHIHTNRTFHGFVLNDSASIKDYCFDDGRIMRTEGNSLFYLPKGSSYHVEQIQIGGCYAINFDSDISDKPFSLTPRNTEALLRNFKAASDAWMHNDALRVTIAIRTVYDAICQGYKEVHRQYISGTQTAILAPAIDAINLSFTENELSVAYLASLCDVSEVYFRRLFLNSFGISPKEYIIQKRIEYAKTLLKSGDFAIAEVAAQCGYAEPCHFSREFNKRTGRTPSQFANQ